jgi:branched-chain amino acid transport system permease protein
MKNNSMAQKIGIALAVVFAVAFPLMGFKSYYLHIGVLSLFHILLALGLNLIAGYAGQLSLAQAAFFGIGAYVSALLMINSHWSFWLAAPAGALVSGLVAVAIGLPTLRLKGPYFVISTMGFGEIVRLIFLNWESLTRGPNGLNGIPAPDPISLGFMTLSFESRTESYYLVLCVLFAVLILYYNFVHSRIGRALRAIRNDYIAAQVMGIHIAFYRILAFGTCAMIAGLTGALYASYIRFISPDTFTSGESINILIMMVIGGMGTIIGPIIGAVFLTYLLETMRVFAEYRLVIYGLLMFIVILYMPQGIAGMMSDLWRRITARKKGV